MTHSEPYLSFAAAILAVLLSSAVTWAIRPLMLRHALAKPNARSSHRVPTPQGAGIAVVAATLVVAATILAFSDKSHLNIPGTVFAASLFIAIVGFADDIKCMQVVLRLLILS